MADLDQRVRTVKARLPIADLVGKHVKLSGRAGATNRRGRCPFHGSNSASFSVNSAKGYAHCFGCQWHGDVIRFMRDMFGLSFVEALQDCEAAAGVSGDVEERKQSPVWREKQVAAKPRREWNPVDTLDMGRWIWKRARPDLPWIRRYFTGRGLPESALTDERLSHFRYLAETPCVLWEQGKDPRKEIHAPAVIALVQEPKMLDRPGGPYLDWVPVGVHVTYLDPDGASTMKRRKPWAKPDDPDPFLPKRRMLGPVGSGAVVLGRYAPESPLWIGEGNETVLSGMALGRAAPDDVGLATLSLDNLQGFPRLWKNGTWPLFDIRPDPERPAFLVPGHRGRVTGLIDSDMKPLRGPPDGKGGQRGERIVEAKGGPIVMRPITGTERARICGELFVKSWRAAGCPAEAMRAPPGMDFNDAIRELV